MEKERAIKNIVTVFTMIERRLCDPTFKIVMGGANIKAIGNLYEMLVREYGSVTPERLVDFCVCTAKAYSSINKWTIKQAFSQSSIIRLNQSKGGARHYEDQWLKSEGLTRAQLINIIADRSQHPLAKYIFMASEETTKARLLNHHAGYLACQASTLGWSPLSTACNSCNFIDECRKETERKYPELYRIRVENGNQTNQ